MPRYGAQRWKALLNNLLALVSIVTFVFSAHGWKKNFPDLNQGVEKISLLREETLLTQWAKSLITRES